MLTKNETTTRNSGNQRSGIRRGCLVALQGLLALLLFLGWPKEALNPAYKAPEDSLRCLGSLVWFEARGEPVKGQRAVLDVAHNRMLKSGKSYCELLQEAHQFPWHAKKGFKPLTDEMLEPYNAAIRHPEVLGDGKFLFFNTRKPPGHDCKKIGSHIFCKEK